MSLYERTISFVLQYIEEKKLEEGAKLPTEPELVAMAGVSMVTVRRALAELAAQGVIRREQGRGTFLNRSRVSAETTRLGGLRNGLGLDSSSSLETRLLGLERRDASAEEAGRLAIAKGASVWEVSRLRLLNDRPMIHEVSVIPMILAPDLGAYFESDPQRSLYATLDAAYGLREIREDQSLVCRRPNSLDKKLLALPRSDWVVQISGISYSARHVPIDSFRIVFDAKGFAFRLSTAPASTMAAVELADFLKIPATGRNACRRVHIETRRVGEETMQFAHDFQTILGRNLIGELKNFVHRPFLLVTMEDMWPIFEGQLAGAEYHRYFVHSVDEKALLADLAKLPPVEAVVGLGGGMAIDTAKYFSWKKRLPLFQVQTALSMNAAWGQRCGVRIDGVVRYIGWSVPQAVYIDYDVIRAAPRQLNYSGIGDILCNFTGVLDWRYASKVGKCEAKWPYDEEVANRSLDNVEQVLRNTKEIRDLTDKGIQVLINGLRWGTSFHGNGWNPRHIEGVDHFFFYALEYETGRKFLHGQPVCLGVYIGALLHKSRADEMLKAIHEVGLDIRPEAMGVTWDDVATALYRMRDYVRRNGLWHSIAHDVEIKKDFVDQLRAGVEAVYGPWRGT